MPTYLPGYTWAAGGCFRALLLKHPFVCLEPLPLWYLYVGPRAGLNVTA